jgi:hypothetical protein
VSERCRAYHQIERPDVLARTSKLVPDPRVNARHHQVEGKHHGPRKDPLHERLGSRTFFIVAATSAKDGKDSRAFPAQGYEFIEDGVARCAVQYFGGGAFGANKSVIWLGTDLDPDMKLVLAAAMSSILQVKVKLN